MGRGQPRRPLPPLALPPGIRHRPLQGGAPALLISTLSSSRRSHPARDPGRTGNSRLVGGPSGSRRGPEEPKRKRPSVYRPPVTSRFLALCTTGRAAARPSPGNAPLGREHPTLPGAPRAAAAPGQPSRGPWPASLETGNAEGDPRSSRTVFQSSLKLPWLPWGGGSLKSGPINQHIPRGDPQSDGRGRGRSVLPGASGSPRRQGSGPGFALTSRMTVGRSPAPQKLLFHQEGGRETGKV